MTLQLRLPPGLEQRLRREAEGRGLSPCGIILLLLDRHLPLPDQGAQTAALLPSPDREGRLDLSEPKQVTTDSPDTILVIVDGPADTTRGPARHPILREWPRPRMPKPPEPPEPPEQRGS